MVDLFDKACKDSSIDMWGQVFLNFKTWKRPYLFSPRNAFYPECQLLDIENGQELLGEDIVEFPLVRTPADPFAEPLPELDEGLLQELENRRKIPRDIFLGDPSGLKTEHQWKYHKDKES
jgi:hypothetical protein